MDEANVKKVNQKTTGNGKTSLLQMLKTKLKFTETIKRKEIATLIFFL